MNLMRDRTKAVYRYKIGNYISKKRTIIKKEEKERKIRVRKRRG